MKNNLLADLRKKINEVDTLIIRMLAVRLALGKIIGVQKKRLGKNILDLRREKQLQEFHAKTSDQYKLNPQFVKDVYKIIFRESKKTQNFIQYK